MSVVSEYETVPVAVDDPDEYLAQLERDKELLAGVRTGEWLDQQVFPPLTYAIPGVIPEGFTVLAGAPKVGKSWFILSLCLAVARAAGVTPIRQSDSPGRYAANQGLDRDGDGVACE